MKTLILSAFVLAISVVPALGGDGKISDQSFSEIGLGDMKQLPDNEGLMIRAKFFHSFTYSFATVNGVHLADFGPNFSHTNLSVGGASAGGFSFAW